MTHTETESVHQHWARLRFSIIGSLLASPPAPGDLQQALRQLAQREWRHPISGLPVRFSFSTLERWFYRAREAADPVAALRSKLRIDRGHQRQLSAALKAVLKAQYQAHSNWSYQLHADNLKVQVQQNINLGPMPSYTTIRRTMKAQGWYKQRSIRRRSAGAQAAEQRLQQREVRSYEVDYVHGLWHLDFHHGSRKLITAEGQWVTPLLLAVIDDHSRIICHAQWYLDETAETLVHGFSQALQKRALPRALMTDNGAAMIAAEFTQGLERLGILHQPTLPYSPYQNGKQEHFWGQIEGRLLPMLEGESQLDLALLNRATQAWVEREYHHRRHAELGCSPLQRYRQGPQVGRDCPDSETLRQKFRIQIKRKQRRSDGTLTVDGRRFEIPSAYRHLEILYLQYARWDLSLVDLIDPHTQTVLCRLYPLDKSANASGLRRVLDSTTSGKVNADADAGIAPLLQQLMADYAATGLPPAYIPRQKDTTHE